MPKFCSIDGCERPYRCTGYCSLHYQRFLKHGDPLYEPPSRVERFWAKVDRRASHECWEWQGQRLPNGYGVAHRTPGNKTTAHRVAWEIANGPIPTELHICHRCDNRPCVNPAHLFLGTRADNMDDMKAKGRSSRGARQWSTRLTDADVVRIRRLGTARDLSQREIAQRFGISQAEVSNIVRRKRWQHVA